MNLRIRVVIFALIMSAILSSLGFGAYYPAGSNPSTAVTPLAGSASSGVYFDHLVAIMLENEGVGDICGGNPPPCSGSNTLYMSSLANSYGISEQDLALINTSWPNYYGIIGASIFGCPSNCYPSPGSVTATNLVDRFESAGVTWKGYFENQPVAAGCATNDSAPYTAIHNGFILFQDITTNSARCNNLVNANPTGCAVTDCALINDLNSGSAPNFMWLSPSDCDNMRGSSVCSNGCTSDGSSTCMKAGDNYLKSLVPNILSSSTFKNTRSALFVTFDEGNGYCPLNGSSENCVYTVWAGPTAKTSYSSPNKYSHYSLTKTIEVNWNLATLTSNDAGATAMTEFFTTTTQNPDFSITANPASTSTPAGSSTSSTITVTSLSGFTGTVSLLAVSSPSGPTVSLNPSTVTLTTGGSATSTLTVSTQSSTPAGTYTVAVTGTSGSLSHSTNLSLTVTSTSTGDFSISANPSTLSLTRGQSGTSRITLTSLSGFSGTVTLSVTSSSTRLHFSLSSPSIVLTSGGTGSATLTVMGGRKIALGTYTVTVSATSGSTTHSVTLTIQIT